MLLTITQWFGNAGTTGNTGTAILHRLSNQQTNASKADSVICPHAYVFPVRAAVLNFLNAGAFMQQAKFDMGETWEK